MTTRWISFGLSAVLASLSAVTYAAPVIRSAAGADAASITAARDQFRLDLGGGNVAGANGSFGGLRREINWDGVPDGFSSPNVLPNDFFNVNSPRGAIFVPNDPGDFFQVSANAGGAVPVEFGDIDPSYGGIFQTFSAQRLFGIRGDTNMDVVFRVPGTNTPAAVTGFGVIFSDVDLNARMDFFAPNGALLGSFNALAANNGLSFLGVSFNAGELIGRVRIISGNTVMNAGNIDGAGGTVDIVAMDDFLFSEPRAIPEPSTALLFLVGATMLGLGRRRRGV
jgi:PEP-CTERM motif